MRAPRPSAAAQRQRLAALDAARLIRALTPEERAEADNLHHRQYMRVYRQGQAYQLSELRRAQQVEARHG